jgi:hypothetical protein
VEKLSEYEATPPSDDEGSVRLIKASLVVIAFCAASFVLMLWSFPAYIGVTVSLVAVASLIEWRSRAQLRKAASTLDWSALTNGEIQDGHGGKVVTFWASGKLNRGDRLTYGPAIFVCLDDVALVATSPGRLGARAARTIRRRDRSVPLRITSRTPGPVIGSLGPAIVDESTGMYLIWRRGGSISAVASLLSQLGWNVSLDDLPPPP